MVSAPGQFIDWSQLASELGFEGISNVKSLQNERFQDHRSAFAELLAPLNRSTCEQVVQQIKLQLRVVNQTLGMLEGQTFESILQEMLQSFALKVGEILDADRTTVFLADKERQELWSTVTTENPDTRIELRLPWHQGIAGEVARTRQAVNVPFDFYADPRSAAARTVEAKTGYRTYTLLALPILDSQGDLLAVVELLNKCFAHVSADSALSRRIDPVGFSQSDEATFAEFSDVFQLILESSRALYNAARRQKTATVLVKATQALNHSHLTLSDTLDRVMNEAQNLLNADRSTIWLVDQAKREVWAQIPVKGGDREEIRLPIGKGYVGQVAKTGRILNIPCDLYHHPDSAAAQRIDQLSGYRTYSLLCIPIFDSNGTLIAVTQLVNKRRSGPPKVAMGHASNTPAIPSCFQTHFSDDDEFFMLAFNIHAGAAIERALMYESLESIVVARTQELQSKNRQLQQEIEERIKAERALNDLNQRLAEMARVDALTRLANRRQFNEHIAMEWRRMRRLKSPLSLILCDIDFFKNYNDYYGHLAGDDCLQRVAAAMKDEIKRPGDLLARYGGEEFVVVLPNTNPDGAFHLAEALRKSVFALKIPHAASEVDSVVTLSLGVATCQPTLADDYYGLIQATDKVLYKAKKQGRNRTFTLDLR
ncbi:MAG: diguanylate cyclase [Cyanobacteria bacterium P01_H01_bin.58]